MEEEENVLDPADAESSAPLAGKFKSVDALVRAYGELEAEFTRRSQKLRALEEQLRKKEEAHAPCGQGELRRTDTEGESAAKEEVPLQAVWSVPLMTNEGVGLTAPSVRPATVADAGKLALGYLRTHKN